VGYFTGFSIILASNDIKIVDLKREFFTYTWLTKRLSVFLDLISVTKIKLVE